MNHKTTSRHAPSTLQLAVRVPRALHKQLYDASEKQGTTGSKMIRALMEHFVQKAEQQND